MFFIFSSNGPISLFFWADLFKTVNDCWLTAVRENNEKNLMCWLYYDIQAFEKLSKLNYLVPKKSTVTNEISNWHSMVLTYHSFVRVLNRDQL